MTPPREGPGLRLINDFARACRAIGRAEARDWPGVTASATYNAAVREAKTAEGGLLVEIDRLAARVAAGEAALEDVVRGAQWASSTQERGERLRRIRCVGTNAQAALDAARAQAGRAEAPEEGRA